MVQLISRGITLVSQSTFANAYESKNGFVYLFFLRDEEIVSCSVRPPGQDEMVSASNELCNGDDGRLRIALCEIKAEVA